MSVLLKTSHLSVSFGGLRAVDEVDISVGSGVLTGLIGPNGAGKTTYIDAITGFVPCSGAVEFDGRHIEKDAPHRRAEAGLSRTWQSIELFNDLTVRENLLTVTERRNAIGVLADLVHPNRRKSAGLVDQVLEDLGLSNVADRMPTELSQGQRKVLGVGRALVAGPKLICMDEPAAGLDSSESLELGKLLRRITDSGVSLLLVDHDMGLVLEICDFIYVLSFGKLIAQGAPAEIRTDDQVISAYLGERSRKDIAEAKAKLEWEARA